MSFLVFGSIIIAIPALIGAFKYSDNVSKLIPALGKNVLLNIITPVLLAIGLFVGK
jgi:1,4-dihydroxy-2-naphthoate octaprenyltransferase